MYRMNRKRKRRGAESKRTRAGTLTYLLANGKRRKGNAGVKAFLSSSHKSGRPSSSPRLIATHSTSQNGKHKFIPATHVDYLMARILGSCERESRSCSGGALTFYIRP